jgi:hypothetical protein
VFHDLSRLAEAPIGRVKPCSSENSGFSKKPGKRRLARSTQFSRNRTPGSSPDPKAAPYHRRKKEKHTRSGGSSRFLPLPAGFRVRLAAAIGFRRLTQREIPLERTNPYWGRGI